jgi:hypothetical protein
MELRLGIKVDSRAYMRNTAHLVRHRSGQGVEESDASDAAYEENLKIDHANQLNSIGLWLFERISMVKQLDVARGQE